MIANVLIELKFKASFNLTKKHQIKQYMQHPYIELTLHSKKEERTTTVDLI